MTTKDDVLIRARGDVGYAENPLGSNRTKYGEWYGANGVPWCAQGLSFWFYDAGLPLPATTSKGFAWCPSGKAWFQRMGRWTNTPEVGHVVFYKFPGNSLVNHVGIVERVNPDGSIIAIEANTNRQGQAEGLYVMRQLRRSYIDGYGIPPYKDPNPHPGLNAEVVGIISTPSGNGYWEVAADGGVFSYGDAQFFGSMGGHPLNAPVVGGAAHPSGLGYWLVASDGGIFGFGACNFFGSMGGHSLNGPVKGMAAHPSGDGYWLTASDGGVFAFGVAGYFGNPQDQR